MRRRAAGRTIYSCALAAALVAGGGTLPAHAQEHPVTAALDEARVHQERGHFQAAAAAFRAATAAELAEAKPYEPDDLPWWYHGGLLLRMGRDEDARAVFSDYVSHWQARPPAERLYDRPPPDILAGLAGAHARAGRWEAARDDLSVALAALEGDYQADQRAAVEAALLGLAPAQAASGAERRVHLRHMELALHGQDGWRTLYPVGRRALATDLATALLELGRPLDALAHLAPGPAWGEPLDCPAEAARLWLLAELAGGPPFANPVLRVVLQDSVAALGTAARREAATGIDLPRDLQKATFAEQRARAYLDLQATLGPRRARLAALGAAEHGRADAAVDSLWTPAWPFPPSDLSGCFGHHRLYVREGDAASLEERLKGAQVIDPGGVTAVADSLIRSGEAALAWLAGTDTLYAWLLLPTGEVQISMAPYEPDAPTRSLAARMLPPRWAELLPSDARIVLAPPPELRAGATSLAQGPLAGRDVLILGTLAEHVLSDEWRTRAERIAAVPTAGPGLPAASFRPSAAGLGLARERGAAGADAGDPEETVARAYGAALITSPLALVRNALGDSLAALVLEASALDSALVAEAAEGLAEVARSEAAAGRHREAARYLETAAVLVGGFAGNALSAQEASRPLAGMAWAGNAYLAAAEAWEAAADSAGQARTLRAAALLRFDVDLAYAAWSLHPAGADLERAHTMLAVASLLRYPSPATADSALLLACSWGCGWVTDEPQALFDALRAELSDPDAEEPRAGSARAAVRSLLGTEVQRGAGGYDPWMPIQRAEPMLAAAADTALAVGDTARAATFLHALGYTLSSGPSTMDADSAVAVLERAAELREASGQAAERALSLSRLALAHLVRGRLGWSDAMAAAGAAIEAAEAAAAAANVPSARRALVRRRHAVFAAANGRPDDALRFLAEAVALRGDSATAVVAADRYWVARELLDAGAGEVVRDLAAASYQGYARAGLGTLAARSAGAAAEAHTLAARPDSAVHWLERALALRRAEGDSTGVGHTLAALAEIHLEVGGVEEAQRRLAEAAEAARGRLPRRQGWRLYDDALGGRILNDYGLLLMAEGNWSGARDLFEVAAVLAPLGHEESAEANRNKTMASLVLGDVVVADSLVTAMRFAGQQWSPREQASPRRAAHRPLTDGWRYLHTASLYARRNELGTLSATVDTALILLNEAGHPASLRRAHAVQAWLFSQLGRPDSAAVYQRMAGEEGTRYAALLRAASNRAGAPAVAEGAADAGRATGPAAELRRRMEAVAVAAVPLLLDSLLVESERVGDRLAEARILQAFGHYHLRMRPIPDPAAATAAFDAAFLALRKVTLTEDWQRIQFNEQFVTLQRQSALAWLARAAELGPAQAAAGALAAAERGRGRAFEALVAPPGRDPLDFSAPWGVLDPWIGLEVGTESLPEIGRDLLRFESGSAALVPGSGTSTLAYLQTADTLLVWLSLPTGELEVVRRTLPADSLGALVARARAAMGVDSSGTRNLGLLEDNPLAGFLSGGQSAVPPVERALAALAEELLPAELRVLLPERGHLLVIPAGPVAAVPFAALPAAPGEAPLSSAYGIRYAPALVHVQRHGGVIAGAGEDLPRPSAGGAVVTDSLRRARAEWLSRALVVGNPEMPEVSLPDGRTTRLSSLPGAEEEAWAVAGLLGATPLTGAAADVGAVTARLRNATVVHLATHGFAYAREERVGDSFVALAPGPTDDGLLTVTEMLAHEELRMDAANLVVLSACQTGLGQLTDSEGTLGLQRAFLARGARSVLVSLWSVSDEATALLLRSFYEHWLEDEDGPTKAEALRRAQEDLRSVAAFSHPRYWAAFQLVGAS